MPFAGTGPFYLSANNGVGTPDTNSFVSAAPATSQLQTVTWAASAAQAERIVKPDVVGSATAPASETTPQVFGWNFLVADMDASTNLPANRSIESGTWTVYIS